MGEEIFSTQRLDHLGIVAGVCRKIKLIEQIDSYLGSSERKVTVGEAVQAMVINALGFVSRALYLTPEFFANKPVDVLIRDGIRAEDLNDDSLGRALDYLYEAGVTEIFGRVASDALKVYGIEHRFVHLDSSSFSLQGKYDTDSDGCHAIEITHGYSKDHRPDLKQAVVSLICSYRSLIPVWLETLSGNSVDKTTFPKTIESYIKHLKDSEAPYFIADSALYSKGNLKVLSKVYWLSRVPETIKEAQDFLQSIEPVEMEVSAQKGYFYKEVSSDYGGVCQRWLVIYSEQAYKREEALFQRQLKRYEEQTEKELQDLSHQEFEREEEAREAIEGLEKGWKFHRLESKVEKVFHYSGRGRPKKDEKPNQIRWCVKGKVIKKPEAISQKLKQKGKFILATNEGDVNRLSAETMLSAYKGQGISVERGFRFLKDPLFFAESLFLKRPERLMALLMVMGLSLLVYALAEHTVRRELKQQGKNLPNQVGKLTQQLTLRRIFQIFEGVDILLLSQPEETKRLVLNLKPIHHQILNLLDTEVKKCYFLSG